MISRFSMRAVILRRPPESDSTLSRLRQGEPTAIGELYDQHHEAIRAFGMRLLGDSEAAEDLVHDVFVRVPKLIARFRGESSLRTFLIGIAVNHARHHVRAKKRRRASLERLGREEQVRSPGPDHLVEQSQFLEQLHRALDTLPLDQRIAFILCDVEERSAKEASELTGAPEATMRTRLFHARKKLRAALEDRVLPGQEECRHG